MVNMTCALCYQLSQVIQINVFSNLLILLSATMNAQKSHKRKRGKQPIVDGDIHSAQVVTRMKITETNNDGTTFTKWVLVSLDSLKKTAETGGEVPVVDYGMDNLSPPPPDTTARNRVCKFMNKVFVLMTVFL